MTTQTAKPAEVFLGATVALVVVTLLAVVFGHLIQQWVPTDILRKVAASVFIGIGIVMFFGKL